MKIFYLILLSLLLSCSTVIKKEYVCGDHPCANKNEFNEYFSKNLSMEIKSKKNKTNKDVELINLNTASSTKSENKNSLKDKLLRLKIEKTKLKTEKTRLLEEKKIKENEKKIKAKIAKNAKSKKTSKQIVNNKENSKSIEVKKVTDKFIQKKLIPIKEIKKNNSINSIKSANQKNICDGIKDCDINKISELLIEKGRNKPYPNITLN